MRAVKAKQLRSIAGYAGKRGVPQRAYTHQQHRPKVIRTGALNEDGTPRYATIHPVTVVLAICVRKTYQDMKRGVLNAQ